MSVPATAEGAAEPPSPREVTDGLYSLSCGQSNGLPNQNTICDQVNGSIGFGQVRGCTAGPADGVPARLMWDAFNTPEALLYEGHIPRPNVLEQKTFDPARPMIEDIIPEKTPVWSGSRDFTAPEEAPVLNALRGARTCEGGYRHVNSTADALGPHVESYWSFVEGQKP